MPRTPAAARADKARKPARPPRVHELECPFCAEGVAVAEADLVEGAVVHCEHCAADPELTREMDERTGRPHWLLVDPFEEEDDERR